MTIKRIIFMLLLFLVLPSIAFAWVPDVDCEQQPSLQECHNCIIVDAVPIVDGENVDFSYVGGRMWFEIYFKNIGNEDINGTFNIAFFTPEGQEHYFDDSIEYNFTDKNKSLDYAPTLSEGQVGEYKTAPIKREGNYNISISTEADVILVECFGTAFYSHPRDINFTIQPMPTWQKQFILEGRTINQEMEKIANDTKDIAEDSRSINADIRLLTIIIGALTIVNLLVEVVRIRKENKWHKEAYDS